jgi:hypothetical protein
VAKVILEVHDIIGESKRRRLAKVAKVVLEVIEIIEVEAKVMAKVFL